MAACWAALERCAEMLSGKHEQESTSAEREDRPVAPSESSTLLPGGHENGNRGSESTGHQRNGAQNQDQNQIRDANNQDTGFSPRSGEERPIKAFVIARHEDLGYLVLKGFKNRKGIHGQLPGGNLDFSDASPAYGAARELFEETGIDVRMRLDRLDLAVFSNGARTLKRRCFFRLNLTDADASGSRPPDSGEAGSFTLKLSSEHVGYVFEKDPERVAEMVAQHSGGKCRQAVLSLECGASI
mmetsp:Transcript_17211/g.33761  ORF Transcript_17211/g.33761 Transcript_17211/m.33761 type:complete len:242 (+) Transcript_17211:84-809(+)